MEKRFVNKHVDNAELIMTGLNISKEIACGKIVFNNKKAEQLSQEGESVILVKKDINPEDIEELKKAQGLLLTNRNTLIYALLLSKTLKKSCILLNGAIVDEEKSIMRVGNRVYKEGTTVSLDGSTGNVYLGAIPQVYRMGYADLLRQDLKKRAEKIYSMNSQR